MNSIINNTVVPIRNLYSWDSAVMQKRELFDFKTVALQVDEDHTNIGAFPVYEHGKLIIHMEFSYVERQLTSKSGLSIPVFGGDLLACLCVS
ncbi:MAG: hypothetical protein GY928_38945 [Colwellia sp.]|nr:hypothetical protein [Colwellia sp.]